MDLKRSLNHARTLELQGAHALVDALGIMRNLVPQVMAVWEGEDAQRFHDEWTGHDAKLTNLHGMLEAIAKNVGDAAARQRDVSS